MRYFSCILLVEEVFSMKYSIKYAGKDFSFLESNENMKGTRKKRQVRIRKAGLLYLNMKKRSIAAVRHVQKNFVMKLQMF